jgi:hypothetical protein
MPPHSIQLTLNSTPPSFGQPSSNSSVSISSTSVSASANQVAWKVSIPNNPTWGAKTYILAVVLADPASEGTGVDPADFFSAGSGNFFLQEEGWTLPAGSSVGTGWVVVAPPADCTLAIIAEEADPVSLNCLIYLYSTDIGVWYVTSSLDLPGNTSA